MRFKYIFEVPAQIEIDIKFKILFGRTTVSYGKYEFKFHRKQIHYERLAQAFLKCYPQVRYKLLPLAEDGGEI